MHTKHHKRRQNWLQAGEKRKIALSRGRKKRGGISISMNEGKKKKKADRSREPKARTDWGPRCTVSPGQKRTTKPRYSAWTQKIVPEWKGRGRDRPLGAEAIQGGKGKAHTPPGRERATLPLAEKGKKETYTTPG